MTSNGKREWQASLCGRGKRKEDWMERGGEGARRRGDRRDIHDSSIHICMRYDEIFLNKLFIIEAAHKAQHFYYSFGFCIKKKTFCIFDLLTHTALTGPTLTPLFTWTLNIRRHDIQNKRAHVVVQIRFRIGVLVCVTMFFCFFFFSL